MQNITDKAKQIKLLLMDVDGVLTNGIIYFTDNESQIKGFHVHDGIGIKLLHAHQIQTGIISAKSTASVRRRANDLDMNYVYLGQEDKLSAYEKIKKDSGFADHQIAFIGDDLPDLPVLSRVGLSVTVPQAPEYVKGKVDVVTKKKGGKGVVREVSELILEAQGALHTSIENFLNGQA